MTGKADSICASCFICQAKILPTEKLTRYFMVQSKCGAFSHTQCSADFLLNGKGPIWCCPYSNYNNYGNNAAKLCTSVSVRTNDEASCMASLSTINRRYFDTINSLDQKVAKLRVCLNEDINHQSNYAKLVLFKEIQDELQSFFSSLTQRDYYP